MGLLFVSWQLVVVSFVGYLSSLVVWFVVWVFVVVLLLVLLGGLPIWVGLLVLLCGCSVGYL